ncbi:hypothetical protein [Pseudobdellovibrio exovorus]|uniref:Uncharacterized protein n=1 Tax=Pseudobdellovibrio exovorus JSS TaxID=1184267 RepID=M4VBZ6_9BACT|nr:hypothetical protein [Pseudobdellovibrio exovorus]AGH96763.1 hypothetical protein A11Q_2547 [Pseudobdellovibrio exovorus JSS]
MGQNTNRRSLFFAAGGAFLVSLLTRTKLTSSNTSDIDTVLLKSDLSTQADRLLDSVIRRNPKHANLTEEQWNALTTEGAEQIQQVFRDLAANHFSPADIEEMARHLSQPAERKWKKFNQLALEEAKTFVSNKIEDVLNNKKSV